MHMKNLGYMLLVALLLCCTCVQCSEKEHQTPPALSEGDDPGGDGGEENPEGLPGYPKGLTVDEFTQELANGSKCLGFYAIGLFLGIRRIGRRYAVFGRQRGFLRRYDFG